MSMWRNEWTTATRENARNRETTMKIRAVMMFAIAQAVLAREHTSGRSVDTANAADQAVQCNRNIRT